MKKIISVFLSVLMVLLLVPSTVFAAEGEIALNPYESGDRGACSFCAFKGVCGFDPTLRGYEKRDLGAMTSDEALEAIAKEVENYGI